MRSFSLQRILPYLFIALTLFGSGCIVPPDPKELRAFEKLESSFRQLRVKFEKGHVSRLDPKNPKNTKKNEEWRASAIGLCIEGEKTCQAFQGESDEKTK